METAIPINHSMDLSIDYVGAPPVENRADKAVAQLANEPGWAVLEGEINAEIERLKNYQYTEGDSVESYGFKALAASLCVSKLVWIKTRVRETERSIRESTNT